MNDFSPSMSKKILITGANGQLGRKIQDYIKNVRDIEFVFTDIDELDITDYQQIEEKFAKEKPNIVINCAAYTNVEQAEIDTENAYKINAEATKFLAKCAKNIKAKFIHISTDYVFDGNKNTPYTEEDIPNPISVYGKSKLEGEINAVQENPKTLIIRTSWLYSEYGKNFALSIIKASETRNQLKVVYDQIGTPTYAGDLAIAILAICNYYFDINRWHYGIYNFSNQGVASWYDFAKTLLYMSEDNIEIIPILTNEFPTKAKRPIFSVLNKNKIINTFGLEIPDWIDSCYFFFGNYIQNLINSNEKI
ncbi:MAG: dTDP-4-dehydrorhamnose reductase [Bacteroidales bacterium]|jgi:dTDP-4-dehydrorhamnose reductase|nr:dTDP-4-dehydrorhamnose reductase [Bacteroidales bacterium]